MGTKWGGKCSLPAWLTVDSVGCDFHSLLAVCVEAITSVTGRLINEPLSLSVRFEEGAMALSQASLIYSPLEQTSKYNTQNVTVNIHTHAGVHV